LLTTPRRKAATGMYIGPVPLLIKRKIRQLQEAYNLRRKRVCYELPWPEVFKVHLNQSLTKWLIVVSFYDAKKKRFRYFKRKLQPPSAAGLFKTITVRV